MIEVPFALEWIVPENHLISLKDSVNGYLCSSWITNISGIKYGLSICPYRDIDEHRGKALVALHLDFVNVKKIEAECTFKIDSANCSKKLPIVYEKSFGWGTFIDETKSFFDPEKKYFVDGNCTLKVNGILKYETNDSEVTVELQKWEGNELGDRLWEKDDYKDFTISVDRKNIKVHKNVLAVQSTVFHAMFESKMKKSVKNKVEIKDFSFDIVEKALKLIYNCNFITTLSTQDMMKLLQFFDKYNFQSLKNKIEQLLIAKISTSTVCRITNSSIITNSTKLKNECMKFLVISFLSKTTLRDIEILDKNACMEVLQNMVYQSVTIQ
uniref:BTB domain-containing protein n=1 Tax=Panagrolaimus davidi TaxID=227884 RepID=A0A914PQ74_9BILA